MCCLKSIKTKFKIALGMYFKTHSFNLNLKRIIMEMSQDL